MDYAAKWANAGYKSGFFNFITNQHIGRLTSEINTGTVKNAYELNNQDQFNNENNYHAEKYHIKIVNLESRLDRKINTTNILDAAQIENYEFVKATVGSELVPTLMLAKLFEGNDFGNRKGVIGCAMSHLNLWKQLLNDPINNYYVIMEDDITICDNFKERFLQLKPQFSEKDFMFLGYHMFEQNRNVVKTLYNNNNSKIQVKKLDKNLYIGGFFAYSINKKGAKILIDYINSNGIKHGIDYLNLIITNLNSHECYPQLAFSEWNENNKPIDSDIQFDYNGLDFSNIFYPKIIRIQMYCNWCSSQQLCKEWSNMYNDDNAWTKEDKQLVMIHDNINVDYYVIINSPPPNAYFIPEKTIVFQMEPWVLDPKCNWGVKTWGYWANPDPKNFLAVRGRKTEHHNNAFWQLELNATDLLNPIIKTKNSMASICSSKYFDEGHIARIDFLKYIETKQKQFDVDIYNMDNAHNFINYRGPLSPYVDKSKGILPYKYYFMIENNYEHNFITEKIWEPILCESLCFYYGCPNLSDYINPLAYVELDITDFEKSYQIIKTAIAEDWWSQRIDVIRQEKQKILNNLAFFPTIYNIINSTKN